MNKFTVCVGLLLTSAWSFAQSNPEKYANTITHDALKKQLSVIASAEMEGRETGTDGQRKAAAYIANEFKRIGLKPAPQTELYQQQYPLYFDSIKAIEIKVDNETLVLGTDYTIPLQINNSAKAKSKNIVFVGYGITDSLYNDYSGKKVKGKMVLMFAGEPKSDSIFLLNGTTRPSKWSYPGTGIADKIALAKKNGAKGVLFISPAQVTFRTEAPNLRKTNIYYPSNDVRKTANVITLSHAAASKILGKDVFESLLASVKAGKPLNNQSLVINKKVAFTFSKAHVVQPASNVVGIIEGTDKKDEYVVLSAHYDHIGKQGDRIFYGADDDGSGTSTIIQMAEAFAQAKAEGNGPRRTIVFLAVSGEEKGLLGSRYYSDHPLFPLNKTSVNLNTDMIGRLDPSRKYGDSTNYVYIIGDDKLSSDLHPITESINAKYSKMELDRKYNDLRDQNRFYYRSDHYNFARKGVPIIFYFNGTHADYHRATDTVDKINFDVMAKRARLIFYTAWEMANRDAMVKRDIPLEANALNR